MLPFPPQNPYGSYFSWNEEIYGQQSGMPDAPMGFAPGMLSAMGQGVGGFNPTAAEFRMHRSRDIAYQQFISRSLKQDARAAALSNAFLQSMSSGAQRELKERMGGMENINAIASFGINMPGIAEYLGGSQRSIAFGSLAAASGGLRMSGVPTFGQDPLHMLFAEQLQSKIMNRYTMPGGAMNLSASQGLNRDQLGGILSLASAQGAFSGLDMGKLDGADQKAKFLANTDTITKIDRFLSNSAKALSNLMDVYGKLSTAELAGKAQQITGLDFSRLGNPEIIQQRLTSLRTTAEATGMDYQTMFEMSARAGEMSRAFGLPAGMGSFVSQESAYMMRQRQSDRNSAGFYFDLPDPNEDMMRRTRDLAGMARDPMGSRQAVLELMMQNKGITGAEAAGIRSQFSGMPSTYQSVSELDRFIKEKFGVSAPLLIQGMGGPMGVLANIAPDRQMALTNSQQEQFRQRQETQLNYMLRYSGVNMSPETRAAGMKLFTTMSIGNLDKLLSGGDMTSILKSDYGAREDLAGMTAAAGTFMKGVKDPGLVMRNLLQAAQRNPLTSTYASAADQKITAEQRLYSLTYRARQFGEMDNLRGQFSGGQFSDAFWMQLGGLDTTSMLNVMAVTHPESVFGFGKEKGFRLDRSEWLDKGWITSTGRGMQFSDAGWKEWRSEAARMQQSFGGSSEGRKFLAAMGLDGKGLTNPALLQSFQRAMDPYEIQKAMQESGIGGAVDKTGQFGRLMFYSEEGLNLTRKNAPLQAAIAGLRKDKGEFRQRGWFSQLIMGSPGDTGETLDPYSKSNSAHLNRIQLDGLNKLLSNEKWMATATTEQKENLRGRISQGVTDAYALMAIEHPKHLAQLLRNPKWGGFSQEFGESLLSKINKMESEPDISKDKKKMQALEDAKLLLQSERGITEPGETSITGELKFQEPDTLKLIGKLMGGKK